MSKPTMTWAACAEAGMTPSEAAAAMNKPICAAYAQARKGIKFRDQRKSAANAERASERMRKLHSDPEFAAAHAERMRKLHSDKAEWHRLWVSASRRLCDE